MLLPEELTATKFSVEMDGLLVASFKECNGLGGEIEVEQVSEGGLNGYQHQLPGRVTWGNVTLSAGILSATSIWSWFHDVSMGEIERRNVSIVMHLQMGFEAMRWNLEKAYPVSYEGPSFTAGSTDALVHSLELAHHGITLGR